MKTKRYSSSDIHKLDGIMRQERTYVLEDAYQEMKSAFLKAAHEAYTYMDHEGLIKDGVHFEEFVKGYFSENE